MMDFICKTRTEKVLGCVQGICQLRALRDLNCPLQAGSLYAPWLWFWPGPIFFFFFFLVQLHNHHTVSGAWGPNILGSHAYALVPRWNAGCRSLHMYGI